MSDELNTRLQKALDSSYHLLQQTQVCHWNVKGPGFYGLHAAFETQYRELFEAVDEIAERIATLGGSPVIGDSQEPQVDPNASDTAMLEALIVQHKAVREKLSGVHAAAAEADDEVSQDLALQRMASHEKTIWMLQSSI